MLELPIRGVDGRFKTSELVVSSTRVTHRSTMTTREVRSCAVPMAIPSEAPMPLSLFTRLNLVSRILTGLHGTTPDADASLARMTYRSWQLPLDTAVFATAAAPRQR